jgi:hypothetical protein
MLWQVKRLNLLSNRDPIECHEDVKKQPLVCLDKNIKLESNTGWLQWEAHLLDLYQILWFQYSLLYVPKY